MSVPIFASHTGVRIDAGLQPFPYVENADLHFVLKPAADSPYHSQSIILTCTDKIHNHSVPKSQQKVPLYLELPAFPYNTV